MNTAGLVRKNGDEQEEHQVHQQYRKGIKAHWFQPCALVRSETAACSVSIDHYRNRRLPS